MPHLRSPRSVKLSFKSAASRILAGTLLGTAAFSMAPPAFAYGGSSFSVRVSASSDDAEEKSIDGQVNLDSSDLELVEDGQYNINAMRFTNILVPQGATISNAYIQFQCDETNSGSTSLTIRGQAVDDATGFSTSDYDISSRTTTTTAVFWSPPAWNSVGEAGASQKTPALSAIIQEIINRPGWVPGNDIVIIVTGTGTRTAESFDGDSSAAPLLHIEHDGPPAELQMHWKVDEASGSTATDSSMYSRTGSVMGTATWIAAPRNNGFDCEAGDGPERIDGGTWSVTGSELSLAAWVRDESTGTDGRVIFKSNGNDTSNQSWGLTVSGGVADFRVTADGTWDKLDATGVVPAGQWTHLVGTFDGTTMRIYVNGGLAASKTHSTGGSISANSAHAVTVGDSPTGARALDGAVDDVRVYSKTLTGAEIAEIYGLIAHWKLDETSGTTADDATLAGHDATLTGTQTWVSAIDGNGHDFDYASGDDYFEAPNSSVLDSVQEDDFTVMAYVKPNSLPPGSGSDNDAQYAILVKPGWHVGLN